MAFQNRSFSVGPNVDPVVASAIRQVMPADAPAPDRPTLHIVKATREQAMFGTDRGRRDLPALALVVAGSTVRISLLDPEASKRVWWPTELSSPPFSTRYLAALNRAATARLGRDSHNLNFHFVGGNNYSAQYSADVLCSPGAVVILTRSDSDPEPSRPHAMNGCYHDITVPLSEPLGNRVLVDLDGSAIEVYQAD